MLATTSKILQALVKTTHLRPNECVNYIAQDINAFKIKNINSEHKNKFGRLAYIFKILSDLKSIITSLILLANTYVIYALLIIMYLYVRNTKVMKLEL